MKRASFTLTLPFYYRWDGWWLYLLWPARLRRQCAQKGFTDAEIEATVRWYFPKRKAT